MPFNQILIIVLKSSVAFFLLLILTRIMGRKAIAQMTFFDFIVAITIGAIAGVHSTTPTSPIPSITALITFTVLLLVMDYLHISSRKADKLINSEPVALVQNGIINDKNMRKTRVSIGDLNKLLRQKNIFSTADVEFAIMENDGELSVLPKSQKQPLTPSDLKIPTKYKGLTKDLIMDGQVMEENLRDAQLNGEWLKDQLKHQEITEFSEVFYAGLDTEGNLYVSKKHAAPRKEEDGKYGID